MNRAIFWLYVRSDSTPSKGLPNPQRQNNQLEPLIQSLQTSSISLSPAQKPSTTTGPSNPPPLTSAEVDICKVTCLCSHFQLGTQKHESQPSVNCLGYLKSPSDCQYRFYPPVISRRFSETSSAALADEATTLIGLIDKSRSGPTELLHQYQLALMICRSVLQFHNTAWLPSNWRLQDISIFGTVLSDHTLKTLHLSTRFESSCTSGVPSREAQGTASHAETTRNTSNLSSVDACCRKLCPSVYNETLFSLGIALLEIAHWQSFQTLGRGDQDEVHAAHRIVRGPPPIGSKYRKVAERCLRCDFGVGSENLEDEDLQHAVWSKVIYPLEALIRDTSQEI